MLDDRKYNRDIIKPIIFSVFYTIYFYLTVKFVVEKDMLFNINDITINNIGRKFIGDFLIMLLIPSILMVIYRKRLREFKFNFTHKYLQYSLIAILGVLFIWHGDFTIGGVYKLFFYLIVVGFGEEFIFRGYVYNQLSNHNRLLAIIISGFFFGILHAILPGIVAGKGLAGIAASMLNEIGSGIIMGYYFIYILEKSKSLYIPILVHTILNYSIGVIAIIPIIGTWVYLYKADKKSIDV